MDVSFVVNKISAYDELYKVRVLFLWSVVCADAKVGGFLVIREFTGVFKKYCVGTNGVVLFSSIQEA